MEAKMLTKQELVLLVKLFSIGDSGRWVRPLDAASTKPIRHTLSKFVEKGVCTVERDSMSGEYHYTVDDDVATRLNLVSNEIADAEIKRCKHEQFKPLPPATPPTTKLDMLFTFNGYVIIAALIVLVLVVGVFL